MVIRRGDIYYADLRPVVGSEQGGVRDDAAALFRFFLFVRCGCAGLAGGTCGGLYALGGDMALLLGFYGNRLLWSVSKRTAKAVTQNRTML